MQIPNSEELIQFSRYLLNSITRYQGDAQALSAGHSNLAPSWKGDGATTYSETHSQMQKTGEMHQQQREQVANMLNTTISPLAQAKILQKNAERMMQEAEIMAAAGPEMEAEAVELAAAAEEMQATAQEIVTGILTRWQTTLSELTESANVLKLKS